MHYITDMENSIEHLIQKSEQLNRLIQLSGDSGTLNAIEHELIKQKCVELYELILTFKNNQEQRVAAPVQDQPIEEVPVSHISEIIAEEIMPIIEEQLHGDASPTSLFAEEETIATPESVEPITDEWIIKPVDTSSINEEIEEIIEQQKIETEQPAQLFTSVETHELSLHEKLSLTSEAKPALADKLQQNLESLKSAISLNKKIAFVNLLFNENTVEYAKAIEKLNNAQNKDEAMRYFMELSAHYNWGNENELAKELQQLLEKRFR